MNQKRQKAVEMNRRRFLRVTASGAGVTVAVAGTPATPARHSPSPVVSAPPARGAAVHPYDSPTMKGFPPSDDDQVTETNYRRSHAKCRWAMQHLRELYPTQPVSCRNGANWELPRGNEIHDLKYCDSTGKETSLRKHMEEHNTDGFLIMRHGEVVFEEYFRGMTPRTPHMLFSLIKSIEATVIATLIGDGILDLEATIEKYVPELKDTAYEGATVRQLLDMESGVRYGYDIDTESEFYRHQQSIGPAARQLKVPVGSYNFLPTLQRTREHGEGMGYKESDHIALVWAAEKVTGIRFADLFSERIWSKVGAECDAQVQCDQLGHWGLHLAVTLRDLARWGQMCLQDGKLDGKQIVPSAFFEDLRNNASVERLRQCPIAGNFFPAGIGYRSYFYRNEQHGEAIAGAGGMGQFCYVNPKYDTVIAFFSSECPWEASIAMGRPLDEVTRESHRLERERWHACLEICQAISAS